MELVKDFMLVLVVCRFGEDPSKTEGAIISTIFFPVLQGKLLGSQWMDVSGTETCLNFYGCPGYLQVWQQYDKKWGTYCIPNIFSIISPLE